MSSSEDLESPRKRLKHSLETQELASIISTGLPPVVARPNMSAQDGNVNPTREDEVGIIDYVSTGTPSFRGLLKKRYTDFLVNEILPNGKVVHLRNLGRAAASRLEGNSELPLSSENNGRRASSSNVVDEGHTIFKPVADIDPSNGGKEGLEPAAQALAESTSAESTSAVSVEDISKLMTCLDVMVTKELLALYNKILASPNSKPRDHGVVTSAIPAEKSVRTTLHGDIRRIFNSKIESSTEKEKDLMTFSATPPHNKNPSNRTDYQSSQFRRQGKPGWAERGGEYLHFSLYKENKDTMEVISYLTRQLKTNPKSFQFAGTKDRRGVTVQRVSAYRVEEKTLAYQGRTLRNAAVGDFEYQKQGLELGDLKGNEFIITLRECQWDQAQNLSIKEKISLAQETVSQACKDLYEQGFFNYYGLQRFGTFATRTDTVGVRLLQGDFEGACKAILQYSSHVLAAAHDPSSTEQIGSDDKARAEAIDMFQKAGRTKDALERLPRKFSAEGNIIRHLGRNKLDHFGAIQMIPRNLKLMYVHAYQSLVWNYAVGQRWKLFGNEVVEGDLVLVKEHKEKEPAAIVMDAEVDAEGEIVVHPEGEDRAQGMDDMFERARALTADEAASGEYSVFDVVLPLPGYDVLYPANVLTEFYKTFMNSERGGRLDPFDMRRKHRDFSLSGSYRKVLAKIESGYDVQVRAYKDDNEQFVDTDMETLKNKGAEKKPPSDEMPSSDEGDKLAVVLKIQLGSSQYATMALREISKGGIVPYKPDFGGGR